MVALAYCYIIDFSNRGLKRGLITIVIFLFFIRRFFGKVYYKVALKFFFGEKRGR